MGQCAVSLSHPSTSGPEVLHSFEEDELPLHTFTIVTCDVNKQLSFLHDVSILSLEVGSV